MMEVVLLILEKMWKYAGMARMIIIIILWIVLTQVVSVILSADLLGENVLFGVINLHAKLINANGLQINGEAGVSIKEPNAGNMTRIKLVVKEQLK